jgi:SAM-dependent methyltransferase
MEARAHWNQVYSTKAYDQVSWYRPHLETSLSIIRGLTTPAAAVIDVGGGESTLVDDLLAAGYEQVTVLDVAETAIEFTKARLGPKASRVNWVCADITTAELPAASFDLWHDRAVFHFLTEASARQAYVERVLAAVRPGGYVLMATFGEQGPLKCSGLDIVRYNSTALHGEFGERFQLLDSREELHQTPWGAPQQFLYCYCRVS